MVQHLSGNIQKESSRVNTQVLIFDLLTFPSKTYMSFLGHLLTVYSYTCVINSIAFSV